MAMFFDMTTMPQFDQLRAQENAIKFLMDPDDLLRPGGDHDLREQAERGGGMHGRPWNG